MKKLWLVIVALVVLLALAAGGVYALVYRPMEEAYADALAASENAPYAEARQVLTSGVERISGNPFVGERVIRLNERLDSLLLAEADRAEAENELAYAADLLAERDPDRAAALRQTLADREAAEAHAKALADAYAQADALEQAGRDEEALAAFLALNDHEDAAQRAQIIRTRLDLAAARAVFTGTNFDEAIAALTALGTAEGQADAEELQQLPGIGETLAQAILDEREAHGPFLYPEDLMAVRGIGESKYAQIRPWLETSISSTEGE